MPGALRFCLAICLALAAPVRAASPAVVASIPPVAGLVGQIMGEAGAPALLFDGSGSVHGASLRPSQIRKLRRAGLLVRVGGTAEPWFESVEFAPDFPVLVLSGVPGTLVLPARKRGDFGHGDSEDHAAGGGDPHMWLDPENVRRWLGAVAAALSAIDPENGGRYSANLASALERLAGTEAALTQHMKALDGVTLIYAHDAFQYFERRYGLSAGGALSGPLGIAPGAASVSRLRHEKRGRHICVVHDATHAENMAKNLFPLARHVTIDPMGRDVPRDGNWVSAFFLGIAAELDKCAGPVAG